MPVPGLDFCAGCGVRFSRASQAYTHKCDPKRIAKRHQEELQFDAEESGENPTEAERLEDGFKMMSGEGI